LPLVLPIIAITIIPGGFCSNAIEFLSELEEFFKIFSIATILGEVWFLAGSLTLIIKVSNLDDLEDTGIFPSASWKGRGIVPKVVFTSQLRSHDVRWPFSIVC
jgi:hypothetical protein